MSGNSIRIGNVEITAVADASGLSAPCNVLFPAIAEEAWKPHGEHLSPDGKSLFISITSFLVRSGGKTILIDTGIGAKNRPFFPNGRLPDALAEAGAPPDTIDIVANTHIHVDHVGWHTTLVGETYVPTFPRAKHLFNKKEWEFFTDPASEIPMGNAYVVDSVLPLRDAADIELVEGEHRLTDEITLLPTPGHTPAHQSFVVRSAGEAGIIWGDICHHPAQVTELWSPVFDMDPQLATKTREAVLRRIEDENLRLVAGHFPFPGFGSIVRVDGKRYWRAG
jgi:glyoxylase-like metal-dependent hydrolase (beta-lactamase superfamily II)